MSNFRTIEISNPLFEADNLRFITVKSQNLKGRGDICVFVPQGNKQKDFPIAILLHGVYGSSWSWALSGGAHKTAQKLIDDHIIEPMILVMPSDGLWGDGSFYTEHSGFNFEKWIVADVIGAVKELIPQVANSTKIFITGLSMGGFGALRIGAKYGNIFDAISGHSSISNFDQMALFVEEELTQYRQVNVEDASVLKTILKYKNSLPPLRFDCGKKDLLINYNRLLSKELLKHNIPHIFEEFEGEHEWQYWQKHLKESLVFFNDQI
jgi:S-formylglutathione hydrolase FrmB